MSEPVRTCPKCKEPQFVCKVIRVALVKRSKEYQCRNCNHHGATPTRALIAAEFALALVVMPVLVHFHPEYSWSAVGELPIGFWLICAATLAAAAYSTFALTKFEKDAPVVGG